MFSYLLPDVPSVAVAQLNAAVQSYLNLGIAASTKKAYNTGLRKYATFCMDTYHQLHPICEDTLLLFVTYLAQQHLSYPTIQVYLSAVRHNQITTGKSWPTAAPRLNYVLKGIRKSSAITNQPKERLPITFPIMTRLHAVFSRTSGDFTDIMIWAACCLAYFGLLRVSEFTTSSPNLYDPLKDLLLSDVALDNRASPSLIQVNIKQSKGDQFRKGAMIYLGKTGHAVCPVQALVQYLSRRGGAPGPLFLFSDGKWLTRQAFSKALNNALEELQMDSSQFNTHSFRIGAATSAKQVGISDSHVKALGRWQSNAYQKYVRLSPQDLARLSKSLASTRHGK